MALKKQITHGLVPKFRSNRELMDNLLTEIEACERRAHKCGALVTAHVLNRAKNALGWEIAGDIEQAGKASRDERPA
jgi:hypothetical protein